jgi:hypothetical protein
MNKELLEDIFEHKIDYIASNTDKYIGFHTESGGKQLSTSELSYKCKEYALRKGYSLISQSRGYCKSKGICFIYKDDWTSEFPDYCLESFSGESEIEAIFKATDWIRTRN